MISTRADPAGPRPPLPVPAPHPGAAATPRPRLVVHLIYALNVGGLETLLVECINHMPADKYRHAVVCLTDYSAFVQNIQRADVQLFSLHKPPGHGIGSHLKLWALLRRLRPQILHTYNLAAMEYAFTAALAGVPVRIHAEHGRDAGDPEGKNARHNFLRRRLAPFIDRYVPVSDDLQQWLEQVVRIPPRKTVLIKNGVDTERFQATPGAARVSPWQPGDFVVGTVARVQDIKDHRGLVMAFARLREMLPQQCGRLRLSIVGDGPLLAAIRAQVAAAGLEDCVWLPGARSDVAALMQEFSVFALPSLAEGTPVSLLEAMACALPVVASRVGGIPEVVGDGEHGTLVAAADVEALAQALAGYALQPEMAARHGRAGRLRIEQEYSMASMLGRYTGLYDAVCEQKLGAGSMPAGPSR